MRGMRAARPAVSNDATWEYAGAGVGDPTEVALLIGAHDIGVVKGDVERSFPRLAEIPFDSTASA